MWSRVPRLVLAVVLATSLAACGDDDPPRADPSSSSSGSSDAGTSDTASASPSVEPATGPVLKSNAYTMHVFAHKGWAIQYVGTTPGASLDTDDGTFTILGGGIGASSASLAGESALDLDAENAERLESQNDPAPKRVANRTIKGVELWVLDGRDENARKYVLGGFHNGYQVNIDFEVDAGFPDGDALIESMLASIEWK